MPDPRLQPGFVTAGSAGAMTRLIRTAARNQSQMEAMVKTPLDRFPAKLTGKTFDSSLGVWAYSWTKRTTNAAGLRVDHPDGVTGDIDSMPAYSFGDGWPVGDGAFPVDVWLRRRLFVDGKGPVYEFPWYCACVAGQGSSGSGGSGSGNGPVTVECCANEVPRDLYATLIITSGSPPADFPLVYQLIYENPNNSFTDTWSNDYDQESPDGEPLNLLIKLFCFGGNWWLAVTNESVSPIGHPCEINTVNNSTSPTIDYNCSPFWLTRTGIDELNPLFGCPFEAFTFDVIITE